MKDEKLIPENLNLSTEKTLGEVGLSIFRQLETQYVELEKIKNRNKGPIYNIIKNNFIDFAVIVELTHLMVSTGVNEGQEYTNLVAAMGNRVLNFYNIKKNKETMPIQFGAFILNAYSIIGLTSVKIIERKQKHKVETVYYIYAGSKVRLQKLKKEFDKKSDPYKPLLKQAPNWVSGEIKTSIGEKIKLIKDSNVDISKKINETDTPIVLNALNKKQKIAYYVKPKMFEAYEWALSTGQNCFEHNSVDTIEINRKIAKKAEATSVMEATEPYVGKVFYQQYQADNRGRLYPLSAYLNELNSDNAKGMLSFYEGKPLGSTGLAQLKHHIANMFGKDKLPHKERVDFVTDNYDLFVSYGMDPYKNKGWMEAEEPFQFLNAVMELYDLDTWVKNGNGTEEEFVSHTICYRDGSNNGLQWLFSLAGDDNNAHLVNVKKSPDGKIGDMYTHVAKAVITQIAEKVGEEQTTAFENYELFFDTIQKLRNRCRSAESRFGMKHPISERKRKVVKWYQKRYKAELKTTDLLYWDKAKNNGFDTKTWRKVVKRNVMTYGYSATKQGMGEQIIQDTRDIDNQYLSNKQHSAARLLGSMVYSTIEKEFPLVSATMKMFKDNCGLYMGKNDKQYYHKTPINNFPFLQSYFKKRKTRMDIENAYIDEHNDHNKTILSELRKRKNEVRDKLGKEHPLYLRKEKVVNWYYNRYRNFKRISLRVQFNTDSSDIAKAKAGISPNTIHNLDSLHLMLVINECDFDIVTCHDSYGGHACDIVEMQKVIREQFKKIIDLDPIKNILDQTGNLLPYPEKGNLDSSEILESEFAFS